MLNLNQIVWSNIFLKFQRLICIILFQKRGAIRTIYGSYISPKETKIAEDLALYERLQPLMDKLKSERVSFPLIRLGSDHDGGYVVIEKDYKDSFLISGGILNDNNFEFALANLGAKVHQIDFSISAPPLEHANLTFSPKRIVGENSKVMSYDVTLDELILQASDRNKSELLLKLDIEGSEWEIFETSKLLNKFSQIFLELHYLDRLAHSSYADCSISAIEKLLESFFPVFISGNNCCGYVTLGGYVLPRVMELTLLNKNSFSPIPDSQISINRKYQSQNYPNKAPLTLKNW